MFNRRENLCYGEIIAYFKQIKPEFQDLKPLVCKIFELILVLSKLRQDLNYKTFVDKFDMNKIANCVISRCPKHKSSLEKV